MTFSNGTCPRCTAHSIEWVMLGSSIHMVCTNNGKAHWNCTFEDSTPIEVKE